MTKELYTVMCVFQLLSLAGSIRGLRQAILSPSKVFCLVSQVSPFWSCGGVLFASQVRCSTTADGALRMLD